MSKLLLTKKEIAEARYKAELELEDIYSRHETCRDLYNLSAVEYIEREVLNAQAGKAVDCLLTDLEILLNLPIEEVQRLKNEWIKEKTK